MYDLVEYFFTEVTILFNPLLNVELKMEMDEDGSFRWKFNFESKIIYNFRPAGIEPMTRVKISRKIQV
jgi:hypothetical protein